MATREEARRHIAKKLAGFEEKRQTRRGSLGDGTGIVSVYDATKDPRDKDYVYVRIRGVSSAPWKVLTEHKFNETHGLPVIIVLLEDGRTWMLDKIDRTLLLNTTAGWGGTNMASGHHEDHEWPDGDPGPDAVNVYTRAIVPLRTVPTGDGYNVFVIPGLVSYDNNIIRFPGELLNLIAYQPPPGQARRLLTYIHPGPNKVFVEAGALSYDFPTVMPPMPNVPDIGATSALVTMRGSRANLKEDQFVDYRVVVQTLGDSGASAAGGAATDTQYLNYLWHVPGVVGVKSYVGGRNQISFPEELPVRVRMGLENGGITNAETNATTIVLYYDGNPLTNNISLYAGGAPGQEKVNTSAFLTYNLYYGRFLQVAVTQAATYAADLTVMLTTRVTDAVG